MQEEIQAVEDGLAYVIAHLREQADGYISDIKDGDEAYKGIKSRHVIEWLIESF